MSFSLGAVNVLSLCFKVGILEKVVLGEIVERLGSFLEVIDLRPVFIAFALLSLNAVLDVDDEGDAFALYLHPALTGIASGNAFLDAFFGVVFTDDLCTGESLLSYGTEGDILAGFDFVSGFLHELQELIVVLRGDDKTVNRLLELLLPARAFLCLGVLLVVHAFVLRGRYHGQSVFLADFVAQKTQLPVCPLVAPVGVVVHKVDGIEDDMVVAMPFVDVGCDDILVLALEPFVGKLLADLMSNFRRDFAYIERLNEVSGNDFGNLRTLLCRESCHTNQFV
jgi:hypothetical protein